MTDYRRLQQGDFVHPGDQYEDGKDAPEWKNVNPESIGRPVPNPIYQNHTKYRRPIKKNCLNCKHFSIENEQLDSDGYSCVDVPFCEKQYQKMYERDKDEEFLDNLTRPEYRAKSKVCFEARS